MLDGGAKSDTINYLKALMLKYHSQDTSECDVFEYEYLYKTIIGKYFPKVNSHLNCYKIVIKPSIKSSIKPSVNIFMPRPLCCPLAVPLLSQLEPIFPLEPQLVVPPPSAMSPRAVTAEGGGYLAELEGFVLWKWIYF